VGAFARFRKGPMRFAGFAAGTFNPEGHGDNGRRPLPFHPCPGAQQNSRILSIVCKPPGAGEPWLAKAEENRFSLPRGRMGLPHASSAEIAAPHANRFLEDDGSPGIGPLPTAQTVLIQPAKANGTGQGRFPVRAQGRIPHASLRSRRACQAVPLLSGLSTTGAGRPTPKG